MISISWAFIFESRLTPFPLLERKLLFHGTEITISRISISRFTKLIDDLNQVRTRAVTTRGYINSKEDILIYATKLLKAEMPLSLRLMGKFMCI